MGDRLKGESHGHLCDQRRRGFARTFGDGGFQISQIFEIFHALLEAGDGLIENLAVSENRNFGHELLSLLPAPRL
jgi:hypothetical protein